MLTEIVARSEQEAAVIEDEFGFKQNRMLTRLSYTDFNGGMFFRNVSTNISISNQMIEKYAPNVVEGVKKLSIWAKNL